MFLNHYTKYRFHSRDFIFLTFSLQYLEKKIFFIVFRGIEKFLRGKYFLLFHAKKSKNIEIRFFLPSINLNVYLEYRKRTIAMRKKYKNIRLLKIRDYETRNKA